MITDSFDRDNLDSPVFFQIIRSFVMYTSRFLELKKESSPQSLIKNIFSKNGGISILEQDLKQGRFAMR